VAVGIQGERRWCGSVLGPHGIGNRRSGWTRAVTTGMNKPPLETPSRPGARLMKYRAGGFEPLSLTPGRNLRRLPNQSPYKTGSSS